jgi:mannan endo-1,4-beta-mannosidase
MLLPFHATASSAQSTLLNLWQDESKSTSSIPKKYLTIKNGQPLKNIRNQIHGYQFSFPKSWNVDSHQYAQYVRLYDGSFRLDLTFDPIAQKKDYEKYIQTLTSSISSYKTYKKSWAKNGMTYYQIDYVRPIIKEIPNDMNHYSYFIVHSKNGIYMFQLKTTNQNWKKKKSEILNLLKSFKIEKRITKNVLLQPSKQTLKPIIQEENNQTLSIPLGKPVIGVYQHKAKDIYDLEQRWDAHFGSQMFYKSMPTNYDPYVEELIQQGRIPLITFHFIDYSKKGKQGVTEEILKGKYDAYIANWAEGLKSLEAPVLVRLANEMNGDWTPWSLKHTYQDPDLYKLAYRYIVDKYKEAGASNVRFVWNPNVDSAPHYSWNDETLFYPGDRYVDWIGLTSYNFGKTAWGKFQTFDQLYQNLYITYTNQFPNKPFLIGEFASAVNGGNKEQFIKEFLKKLPSKYRNIRLAIWFNEIHKPYDFRISSSSTTETAFRTSLTSGPFTKRPIY